jgi:CheY-like chemotaxis protein
MFDGRILVVDDNPAIHEDFRKIFAAAFANDAALSQAEVALFGEAPRLAARPTAQIDSALQGQEAVARVRDACAENRPYALAFVDVRMPPGWDGIETAARIWEQDSDVQIVICTAYSDYSWEDMLARLGHTDRLVILKKPFDNIEVLQLANALREKWRLARAVERRLQDLERRLADRTRELQETKVRLMQANERANTMAQAGLDASRGEEF